VVPAGDRLLAGWAHGEDAALWTLDEKRAGILTVDFITPVVDDPYIFGQIAAANALSDVFAMGGTPVVALNVAGFPANCQPVEILRDILKGGQERVLAAGAVLAGGHSVEDEEPKYGLTVYGEVDRDRIWRVTGARPGDALILTKPLGTGMIITALQAEMDEAGEVEAAVKSMTTLNDLPRHLPEEMYRAVSACTDVTGFGLAGHLLDMLAEKDLDVTLDVPSLPFLPGAAEKAAIGLVPAGTYRNRELYEGRFEGLEGIVAERADVLFDAQTSGGLLLAVAAEQADALLDFCRAAGFPRSEKIGLFQKGEGRIKISPGVD
jgi:selenide,water dikinase